jgi:protein TonB
MPPLGPSSGNQLDPEAGRRRFLSLAGGILISFLILLGISLAQKTKVEEPPLAFEKLRSVALPEPPPPSPDSADRETPPMRPLELTESPSISPIRLAASPPTVRPIARPSAVPDFTLSLDAFRPRRDEETLKTGHVFRRSEVDQTPIAVYQKMPSLPPGILFGVEDPRITLLFVVTSDGTVDLVKLLRSADEDLDQVMVETIKEWRFRPAIRNGRRVACWVQQPFYITRKQGDDRGFADFR